MHSKRAPEEFAQSRTTPEECKAVLAMVKTFTSVLPLSRLQRSPSNRKPSRLQTSRLHWPPADAMIRVFFHAPCRSSKQWPRWFFVITRCVNRRFQLRIADCGLRIEPSAQRSPFGVMLSGAKHLWLFSVLLESTYIIRDSSRRSE